jgi:DHA1 family tetracycline resistance protein-like MFS transporter
MAAIVQGGLMKRMLKVMSAQRLAALGLVSSTACFLAWGLATQGWMMIVIVVCNLFGFTTVAALQSLISNAADDREQGQTMGAVASLNSVTGVVAPVIAAMLLTTVSGRPPGDVWLGLPFYFCAALQGLAAFVAIRHFQRQRGAPAAAAAAP